MHEVDVVALATEMAYQTVAEGDQSSLMPGYRVERIFLDQWNNTGFYAVAFLNEARRHALIGIRGSQDRLDFIANANLGINQYACNRGPLLDYVGSRLPMLRVTVAGHSLGGGLSQYLGYDAAREFPRLRHKLDIHTHNGFGGTLGIAKVYGRYEPEVLTGVQIRNYRHRDDPVSRIGGQAGGHVLVLPEPSPLPRGLFYAHSNRRFLPRGGTSVLVQAVADHDRPFDLVDTLSELGAELSTAIHEILAKDAPVAGLRRLYGLIRRLPADERAHVADLVQELLPFRRLWAQSLGRFIRKASESLEGESVGPERVGA